MHEAMILIKMKKKKQEIFYFLSHQVRAEFFSPSEGLFDLAR